MLRSFGKSLATSRFPRHPHENRLRIGCHLNSHHRGQPIYRYLIERWDSMSNDDEVKKESLKRARDAHVTVYLTLTSIVQGAVLAYLLSFVSLHSSQIALTGWILSSVTFLLVIITWNEYVMGVIAFRWIPDLLDSCIPFMFGASQYFLVNAISDDPTKWIFRFIAFSTVSFLAFRNMYSKARYEDGHNAVVLAALGAFVRVN